MSEPGLGKAVLELTTDDTKLKAGLDKVKGESKGLESTFKSAGESAKAFSAALSSVFGEDLERRAKASATGILQVGGAMKLTDGEVKTHLATLNAWIEKAGRLGKEVPSHMLSTRDALKQVEMAAAAAAKKADDLKNLTPPLTMAQKAAGLLSSTFGQFTLAGLATQAISKLGAEVSQFVAVGMKLPAVEQSFGRLTAAARVNGQAMLANMTASTRGMVANYDLMLAANKAMLLGLPITADGMGALAKSATVLGRAMGKDAASSVDDLITALGRSSPQILDNLGLSVKLGEANDAYAAKMKIVGRELTEAEKKMAFYEAAMAAAKKKTAELGDQTLTLGEVITSVWTQIGNVVSGVAATINVGIGSAVSSVQGFATFMSDVAKHGAGGAAAMSALREQMKAMAAARAAAMGKDVNLTSPESELLKLQAEARKAVAAVVPLTAAQRDLALMFDKSGLSVAQITEKLAPLGVSMKAVQNAIDANKKSTTEAASAAKRYADLVAEVTQANQSLTLGQIAQVRSLEALGVGHGKIADFLRVTEAQVSKYTDSLKEQAKALAEIGKQINSIPHNARLRLAGESVGSGIVPLIDVDAVKKASIASGAIKRISDATWGDIEGRMKAMGVLTSAELGRLAAVARERFESMRASGKFTADELAAAWKNAQAATNAAIGKTSGLFGSLMADLGKIPGMIIAAFQGGGGGEGAAKGVGAMLGSTLGSHLSDSLKKHGGKLFQGALGDVFAQAIPALGALIGPLAGAMWGKLFGTKGRDLVKDFAATFETFNLDTLRMNGDGFDNLHKQLNALGADGEKLWIALTQGVGRNNPEQAKHVIDAITQALAAQKDKTAEVAQAAVESSTLQQEALDGITAKYADTIAAIDSEYKSLSDSVAQEAEEDVMGLVEMQQRARMQQLEDDKRAVEAQRDAEIAAKRDTFDTVLDAAQTVDRELRTLFGKPYEIPVIFNTPAGGYAVSSPGAFLPEGGGAAPALDPAALRAHEQSIVVKLNERVLVSAVARGLPRELVIAGIGGR